MIRDRRRPSAARSCGLRMLQALLLLLLLGCVPAAGAQSLDCSVSATPVAFGTYDPMQSAALDGAGEIIVDCRRTNSVLVFISLGTGSSGSYAARRMRSGANGLAYNLYLDANASRVFGNGSGGSQWTWCLTGVDLNGCDGSNPSGQGRRATLPFYGRIPPEQDAAAGLYSDTVVVRIDF